MVRGVRLGVTAKTLARGRRFNSAARERVGDDFRKRNQVVVCIGLKTVVILPDEDVDLGVIGDDELIVTGEKNTSTGLKLRALKMKRDDPRAPKH